MYKAEYVCNCACILHAWSVLNHMVSTYGQYTTNLLSTIYSRMCWETTLYACVVHRNTFCMKNFKFLACSVKPWLSIWWVVHSHMGNDDEWRMMMKKNANGKVWTCFNTLQTSGCMMQSLGLWSQDHDTNALSCTLLNLETELLSGTIIRLKLQRYTSKLLLAEYSRASWVK